MEVIEDLLSWETITSMIKNKVLKFGRTKSVMDSYKAHKTKLAREWNDINSYCKHRMLGYPYATATEIIPASNESGTIKLRTRKFVHDDSDCPGKRVVIMDNEFPYAFSPDVLHKVIWSADELTIEQYRLHLNEYFSDDDYDIVMFINPIHQKSVAGVHHGHALMRKKHIAITDLITHGNQSEQGINRFCRSA